MKIVNHRSIGHFDWLISENQSVSPSREPISISRNSDNFFLEVKTQIYEIYTRVELHYHLTFLYYSFRISVPLQNPKVRAKRHMIRHNFDNVIITLFLPPLRRGGSFEDRTPVISGI